MSSSRQGFLKAHWDWLVAIVGLLGLGGAAVCYLPSFGTSIEDAQSELNDELPTQKPSAKAVAAENLDELRKMQRMVKTPPSLSVPLEKSAKKDGNFLTSQHRVFCRHGDAADKDKACGLPIPAELEVCPFCGVKQTAIKKVEADSDHDGLPNEWELKFALNPNDASDAAKDSDKDGFTNLEEYEAKTDPKNPESHPDYLDYLTTAGALKQNELEFYFNAYNPIPGGYRFTFQRLGKKGYDSKFTAKLNEEIGSNDGKKKTGWSVIKFEKKVGTKNARGTGKTSLKVADDQSFVTLKRAKDGRELVALLDQRKIAIDTEAELAYSRGDGRKITVSVGTEFELNGSKYRVESLHSVSNGCSATILDLKTKKQKTIR